MGKKTPRIARKRKKALGPQAKIASQTIGAIFKNLNKTGARRINTKSRN